MRKLQYVLFAMLLLGKPEAASACQMENPQSEKLAVIASPMMTAPHE